MPVLTPRVPLTVEQELAALEAPLTSAMAALGPDVEYVCEHANRAAIADALTTDGFRVAISIEPGRVARLYIGGWNDPPEPEPQPIPEPEPAPEPTPPEV